MEFRVGDKVRLTGVEWSGEDPEFGIGTIHTVTRIDAGGTALIGDATTVGECYILPDEGYDAELVVEETPHQTTMLGLEALSRMVDQLFIVTPEPPLAPFEQSVRRHTDRIAEMLIEKNKSYGDAALNPVRVFSKADREEQLYVRIDDKISRIQRGTEFANEDTIDDLIGYLILLKIAKESA